MNSSETTARAWRATNDREHVLPLRVAVKALDASPGGDVDTILRAELARVQQLDAEGEAWLAKRAKVVRDQAKIRELGGRLSSREQREYRPTEGPGLPDPFRDMRRELYGDRQRARA